jgi:hypothetical protein
MAGREAPAVSMTPTMPGRCGEIAAMVKQLRGILLDHARRFRSMRCQETGAGSGNRTRAFSLGS